MLFRNSGAFAALLLFTRSAFAAPALAAAPAATTDDYCEADETITSTIHASASGVPALSLTYVGSASPQGSGAPPSPSGAAQLSGSLAAAVEQVSQSYVTEVIYQTNIHTVTSCGASITNCPAESSSILSTEIAAVTTTYVVSATGGPRPSAVSAADARGVPAPSGNPSGIPSGVPSGAPSGIPSGIPSGYPSGAPSSVPSYAPSGVPSGFASAAAFPSGSGYISGAPLPSGVATTQEAQQFQIVTETYYSTNIHTVLSCAESVTDCPLRNQTAATSIELIPTASAVVTRTVPASNAAVPTSSIEYGVSSVDAVAGALSSTTPAVQYITATVYATNVHTVLSCASSVSPNLSVSKCFEAIRTRFTMSRALN